MDELLATVMRKLLFSDGLEWVRIEKGRLSIEAIHVPITPEEEEALVKAEPPSPKADQ